MLEQTWWYEVAANIVTIFHAGLIIFVFLGILLGLKIRWFRPIESLFLLTAVVVWSIFGGCPLTYLEHYLRLHTENPIPLSQTGFIPYYAYQWFGVQISNMALVILTYATAGLFLVVDVKWLLPSFTKSLLK